MLIVKKKYLEAKIFETSDETEGTEAAEVKLTGPLVNLSRLGMSYDQS